MACNGLREWGDDFIRRSGPSTSALCRPWASSHLHLKRAYVAAASRQRHIHLSFARRNRNCQR